MEIAAIAISLVLALYFGIRYFIVNVSMMAYIYWTVEKGRSQPTREELDACKKEVLRQMFR